MRVVHSLPGNSRPPVAPFVSLVVNINVHTEGHRDRKDLVLCLVIPIGEFEGGELVMYEQGLVVELRSGDFIVFCSAETTHFNLEYTGQRASFVFQTDSEFKKWLDGGNGWENNVYFN
jgi:predicted 2-oxoglutarate/Fe(II)-dependent dioxygenase YbiX